LALISEFNVQILYLPGLENVDDFFFCPPPPNLLKQSPTRWRQIQSILKLWLPSKTAAQKCSACLAVHPSNWLFAKQALNTSLAMSQQAFFTPLFHQNSEKTIFSFSQHFTSWEACLLAYGIF
jgi:hypothetical protein